ncbi:MAG: ABC transporter permease, partial [Pirellulaceae bacterium]|nr:ABC transporter permease [Pirellulaceae bacterium]
TASKLEKIKPIIDKDVSQRSPTEIEFLNRQLMRISYSADLRAPRGEAVWFGYAGIKIGNQLPLGRTEVNKFIEGIALQIIIRFGLSFIVVFVGLIITSPMIPETFRSGSLHLLLSKPVARPLIYLTKFIGGTLFVLINIAYLLIGLYLLVGMRLGIWNVGLILCIPLLLFVFIIFYSVSALVGLIWNNPIICVVVCIVFWLFCATLGAVEGILRMPAQFTPQIVRFQTVDQDLLAITQAGAVNVWNEKFRVWQPAADIREGGPVQGRVLGPIHDVPRGRLIMRSDFLNGFGDFQTQSRNFVVADLTQPNISAQDVTPSKPSGAAGDAVADGSADTKPSAKPDAFEDNSIPKDVEEARRKARWPSDDNIEPPMLMLDLLQLGEKTLAVTRNGIFEIDWPAYDLATTAKATTSIFGDFGGLLNRLQPKTFKDLTPEGYLFGEDVWVTTTPDQQSLIILNGNQIDSLRLNDKSGQLEKEHSITLEGDERQAALIAASNEFCVVAREGKPLIILDRQLSKIVASVPMPGEVDARQINVARDSNRFSLVNHSDQFYILDAATAKFNWVNCPSQGSITGVSWISDKQVWLGVRPNVAALVDVSTGKVERTLTPEPSRLDFFYNWIARPLYLVSPKPSSLNGVLQTLLQRDRTGQTQIINNDLSTFRQEIEVWQPIISNLIFVAVLLGIGCLYVWRKEF